MFIFLFKYLLMSDTIFSSGFSEPWRNINWGWVYWNMCGDILTTQTQTSVSSAAKLAPDQCDAENSLNAS